MSRISSRAHERGRGTVPVLVILIVVAAAVAVAHAWLRRDAAERATGAGPASASTAVARPVANTAAMGHAQLLAAARRALTEHRLLAPAGDNAFAYYLEARKRQPHNPVAAAALRELFPFAVQSAEQTINAGQLEEAQRQIDLLDAADPTNYSLNILRAKLDAQRSLAQTAHLPPPRSSGHAPQLAVHAPSPAPVAASKAPPPAAAPAMKPVAAPVPSPAPAATTRAPALAEERTPPLLLRDVRPAYPQEARHAHRQGWVDVAYTVDRTGRVVDARVVDAHPTHVFDVAALSAVRHWEFKPAQLDGHPVPQKVRSRIEFKL